MGDEIGNALFAGRISQRFAEQLHLQHDKRTGVRIRLHIDDENIAQIPWETIRFNHEYLGLRPRTPIVRYVAADAPSTTILVTGALRVLGIVSSPSDMHKLDVEKEQKALTEVLQPLIAKNVMEISWLLKVDAQQLRNAVRRFRPHIIHYIGHGIYDEKQSEGYLLFINNEEKAERISATTFTTLLRDSEIRFIFLNACQSGRTSGGLAETLVRRGIPAALGMQTNVRDDLAIAFATEFYRALGEGLPVDAATVEGRMAIVNKSNIEQPNWAQPVLYMRSPNGQLFTKTAL